MTVIYADTLFLLNGLVDYLLILVSARVAGEPLRRLRFAGAAVLGGAYAVGLFLPAARFLGHPLCRTGAAALMLVTAYGGSRRLLRQCLIFLALTCAFAGGLLAIGLLDGQGLSMGTRGVLYSTLDLKMVLLSAAACYVLLGWLFQRAGTHSKADGGLVVVRLRLGERMVELTGLTDTGNTLTDPVTGCPVLVAEGERVMSLIPPEHRLSQGELTDPAQAMTRLGAGEWRGRFRLLPYRSVGVERGLLLGLRVDRAEVEGKAYPARIVALSPTPVSDGGAYQALVGQWQ